MLLQLHYVGESCSVKWIYLTWKKRVQFFTQLCDEKKLSNLNRRAAAAGAFCLAIFQLTRGCRIDFKASTSAMVSKAKQPFTNAMLHWSCYCSANLLDILAATAIERKSSRETITIKALIGSRPRKAHWGSLYLHIYSSIYYIFLIYVTSLVIYLIYWKNKII